MKKKKVAIVLCNDMHMDIDRANVMLNYIAHNNNYEIVCDYTIADIVIIYACAFGANKMYSMRVIADVRLNALKSAKVIVTGCLLKIASNELKEIPNLEIKSFNELLEFFNKEPLLAISPMIPQNRVIVSEGCMHRCSYCVYPLIVDKYKSKTIEEVLLEVERLYETESTIYITGAQETSDYGIDLYGKRSFGKLLDEIASKFSNCNYIIGWFHPSGLTDEVISVIAKHRNIVEIMMHIQHVDSKILRDMNRRPSIDDIGEKIHKLKELRPDILISTEVIVGFPGETLEKFRKLVDYLEEENFNDIGVASYEAVLGTKAATLPNQVSPEIKEARMNFIKERFSATCYPAPADQNSDKSVIEEYKKAYEELSSIPRNLLVERQIYANIAGVDTTAKLEELEIHLNNALNCVISSRSEFEFNKNKKYLMEKYTVEARELFCKVIECGDFKEAIKERAKLLLL